MSAQGDYELRCDRERDAAFDAADLESCIELSIGDGKALVYYVVENDTPAIVSVEFGCCVCEPEDFSKFRLDDWTDSIKRHLRAEADEARFAA